MNGQNQIWLKPKPSHIDENFQEFLDYLKNTNPDIDISLYNTSIQLLEERVNILLEQRFGSPFYHNDGTLKDFYFNIRLCGAWLLTLNEKPYMQRKLVYLTMINNFLQYCMLSKKNTAVQESLASKSIEPLLHRGISCLKDELPENFPFSWRNLTSVSFDILLHAFLHDTVSKPEYALYQNRGMLLTTDGCIKLAPFSFSEHENPLHMELYNVTDFLPDFNIKTINLRSEQIKETHFDDITSIDEYLSAFLQHQVKALPSDVNTKLLTYNDGDCLPAEVVDVTDTHIIMRSIDPHYETLECKLVFEQNLKLFEKFYPYNLWQTIVRPNMRFYVTYNEGTQVFSITEQFIDYIESLVDPDYEYPCKFRRVPGQYRNREFWSDEGFMVFVNLTPEQDEEIGPDQYAMIAISHWGSGQFRGCMYGEYSPLDEPADFPYIERDHVRKKLIENFLREEAVDDIPEEPVNTIQPLELDERILKEFCRTLNIMQSRQTNPVQRYRELGIIRILSRMAGFSQGEKYMEYISDYLKTLVLFANASENESDCIKELRIPEGLQDEDTINHGEDILKILACFAKPYADESTQILQRFIESGNDLLVRTASMVQSYNRLKDDLDTQTLKGIKRQILHSLSVITEGDSSVDLAMEVEGIFGGEDDMKEFKESFFEPPRTAAEQRQFYTIMKAICGMMNNRGGVVYIGVNDQGKPIGVSNDLRTLQQRYKTAPTMDKYMIYISHVGSQWLGETFWSYVSLKPIMEYNVLSISVEPYPYDVVYLSDKTAWLRKNCCTDIIREQSTIDDIRRRRRSALRKSDDKIILLQDAISNKKMVQLLGYQSSSSGEISNRIVEPFKIVRNEYIVACEHGNVKLFKLSRIERIASTDKPWINESLHKDPDIDVFNMMGNSNIAVELRMNLRAKNALVELYPATVAFISRYGEKEWMFKANVKSLEPVLRFYLSYADAVEIIEAKGLKADIKQYIKSFIN